MAKRINRDPSPYLTRTTGVEREVVSRDFNLFYRPDVKPQNKGLNSLIASLSNIVPELADYQITKDVKKKEKDEAKAIEEYNLNKNAWNDLIKDGKIPEGASPHYYNKMMELDLQNKARLFKRKFDTYYMDNDLANTLNPDGFSEDYDDQLKLFYKEQELDNYDPLALKNAFFNTTDKFRNERYQQHQARIMVNITNQTEKSFTMNVSGTIIDGQGDAKTANEVLTEIKGLTDGLIGVAPKNKGRVNDLFIKGLNKYIETVNDEEGFEFAQEILVELETFKLGTGKFGGSKEGSAYVQELKLELASKHLSFLQGKEKREKANDANNSNEVRSFYWDEVEAQGETFNLSDFTEEKLDNGEYRFTQKEKTKIIILHNGLEKNKSVTTDDDDALQELMKLQDDDIYAYKDRLNELFDNGKLTNQTYKTLYTTANTYNLLKNNIYFINSLPYKNYLNIFKDIDISQMPIMKSELPLIKNKFQVDMWNWYQENKKTYKGRELQKQLDLEAEATIGAILSNSLVIQSSAELQKAFRKYNLTINIRSLETDFPNMETGDIIDSSNK